MNEQVKHLIIYDWGQSSGSAFFAFKLHLVAEEFNRKDIKKKNRIWLTFPEFLHDLTMIDDFVSIPVVVIQAVMKTRRSY